MEKSLVQRCQWIHFFSASREIVPQLIFKLFQINSVSACGFQLSFNVDVTKYIMLTNSWNSSDSLFTNLVFIWGSSDDNSVFSLTPLHLVYWYFCFFQPWLVKNSVRWLCFVFLREVSCCCCFFFIIIFRRCVVKHSVMSLNLIFAWGWTINFNVLIDYARLKNDLFGSTTVAVRKT